MRPALAAGLGLGLALLAAVPREGAAAQPRSGACRISVEASVDHESFRQAGHPTGPARLSSLNALTRERFNSAARRLCAAGILRPSDLARFRRLVVQNGEGATEPLVFQQEGTGRDVFVFQYAFQDGGPPVPAEFEKALRCWKRPRDRGCDVGD